MMMKTRQMMICALACALAVPMCLDAKKRSEVPQHERGGFEYFVGLVGNPAVTKDICWDDVQLEALKDLGCNMLQLSLAWGGKPADEVINLEDLEDPVQVGKWKYRISQCQKHGFKTLAHFGIPRVLNADPVKPACIMDPQMQQKYANLMRKFMNTFPEVNDVLIYTFDQQAWLCSEFGPCPRCTGIPLGERLPQFINMLKDVMRECRPGKEARLWWKPWELSKGQTIGIIKDIDPEGFGLVFNSSTSNEVYPFNDGSLKSDLGVKRFIQYAYERGIPVMGEIDHTLYKGLYRMDDYFPRLIFEQMNGWKELKGVVGVKEYYGFAPSTYSANYAMLEAWMKRPDASLDELLNEIAAPYGKKTAPYVINAWEYVAQCVEAFPWDVSYLIGPLGLDKSETGEHSWEYVKIVNGTWDTPIWESARRANFMLTDADHAHPWIFEDTGLRLQDAAELAMKAVEYYDEAIALNEGKVADLKEQRRSITELAKSLKGKSLHYLLTIAAQDARTVQHDEAQFKKVCDRIERLLQEDIDNGYAMAEEKLKQFKDNPKLWLKSNFSVNTWRHEAAPRWDKWITTP